MKSIAHALREQWIDWQESVLSRPGVSSVSPPQSRQRISISLDPLEHRRLLDIAAQAGLQKTPFVKRVVLAALNDARFLTPALETAFRSCTLELRKIGNLVNQIARHANTVQRLRWGDAQALQAHIQAMEECVQRLLSSPSALNVDQKPYTEE